MGFEATTFSVFIGNGKHRQITDTERDAYVLASEMAKKYRERVFVQAHDASNQTIDLASVDPPAS